MNDNELEILRKRDALALAQLIYDIYIEKKDETNDIDVA
jgi:hypothetical protein